MSKKIFSPLFWVVLVSLLPVISLFTNPGLPLLHDGQDHVARIANFYTALTEGVFVPRWAVNLNWGYGHPVLMFLYPFPSYLASAIHAVGFSLVDSTKLVFALSFIASGITMFIWMKASWGRVAGVVGALLYMFAPYRFVDLHVRGAIGEHVAFVFPPLVLYCLLKKKWIGLSLSMGALILSHNAIALMFLPIIGLYFLYLTFTDKSKKITFFLTSAFFIFIGFGVASFFWVPAFFEGRFTLRDIVTSGQIKEFVPWSWFIYSPWNFGFGPTFSKSLGIAQWIGVGLAGWHLVKTKNSKYRLILIASLIILVGSFFIMSSSSLLIWRFVTLLEKFQFPWRFLSVSVFIAAVIGGIGAATVLAKKKILWIGLCVVVVVSTFMMWHPKGYQNRPESFYTGVYYSTTDTGESSPIWSVRAMEHTPANFLDVVDGDATIRVGTRKSTVHEYTVTVRKPTLLMENTLYFPGWMIYINGIPTGIEWQNPTYRGLMTFRMTPGENQTVRVVFGDTKVRLYANMASIASFVALAVIGILWHIKRRYQ